MACTLEDIVVRRTELGAEGKPPDALIAAIAGVAAGGLQWDPPRVAREIERVNAFYRIANP
jgi:glycerol-3-phosphate dehydrogenase